MLYPPGTTVLFFDLDQTLVESADKQLIKCFPFEHILCPENSGLAYFLRQDARQAVALAKELFDKVGVWSYNWSVEAIVSGFALPVDNIQISRGEQKDGAKDLSTIVSTPTAFIIEDQPKLASPQSQVIEVFHFILLEEDNSPLVNAVRQAYALLRK